MPATTASQIISAPKPEGWLKRLRREHPMKVAAGIALAVYAVISHLILRQEGPVSFRLDFAPLLHAPWVLQAHVGAALATFGIGCVLLAGVKGRAMHRTLGYIWVACMGVTAVTSLFLQTINPGTFSFIHALSAWTVIVLPMGLAAARRRKIAEHRKHMTSMFTGGMLVAGLFSFLPGRLMWHLFFTA